MMKLEHIYKYCIDSRKAKRLQVLQIEPAKIRLIYLPTCNQASAQSSSPRFETESAAGKPKLREQLLSTRRNVGEFELLWFRDF